MAAQDLTTLAIVRSFLQKSASDTTQDAEISAMITRASDAISRYCEREFKTTGTNPFARTFEYKGGGLLDLSPFDLQSLSQVRFDTDTASPTTLLAADYRLVPVHKPLGVYTALRIDPAISPTIARWSYRVIEVTGTWGFASVPKDVEHACILTVNNWLKLDVTAYESVLSVDEPALERPQGIPSRAQMLLKPFVRTVL